MTSGQPQQLVTGVILAGGQSRRMGRDKAQLIWQGQPLWQHLAEIVAPQVAEVMISYNGDPQVIVDRYPHFVDSVAGHQGPLAGVATALERIQTPWLFTAPVDVPLLPGDVVASLWQVVMEKNVRGVSASSLMQKHGTISLWHRDLLSHLQKVLAEGRCGVHAFQKAHAFEVVDFPVQEGAPDPFTNLNTPEELSLLS
uniref:Molybdenum cofactor guanylyltransferase n=1 Tax=Magnetococcus massalia (strain MO-1) TaxID=451514 RepID=A0A1S7LGR4_MAGMO|nr:putative molybdopterin-guanine dinucleotide biosynthesis protein A [Candidatus Magnetococcus massalia]